jgi:hypothetical protein
MANIGKVYRDSYDKDGKQVPLIMLDIRTISIRKKFTIAVNKLKWESGVVGKGVAVAGKEDHPDYHIWYNMSNRGESIPSEIVGSIKDMVSEGGVKYKKANIFDPFIQKEAIYFTLFPIDEDKKIDKNQLYNVVAQPYRKMNNNQNYQQQAAQPNCEQQPQQGNTAEQEQHDNQLPIEDDEIPF